MTGRRAARQAGRYGTILLVRTDRIGDVVLTLPAAGLLKKRYPSARVLFLARAYTAPLVRQSPAVDGVVVYDPEGEHRGILGHLRLARTLREEGVEIAFLFHARPELAFALRAARVRERVGTAFRWYSFLLNRRVYAHKSKSCRHELEYNLELLTGYVEGLPAPSEVRFDFGEPGRFAGIRERALSGTGAGSPYAVVHPGSGGSSPNLPPAMYGRVVQYLAGERGLSVLLAGAPGERELLGSIYREAGEPRDARIATGWSLEEYMGVISGCSLFVSSSTGPLHIARAFDVPLLGFYCPAVPFTPVRWGPYARPESVLVPGVDACGSWDRRSCRKGACLGLLRWEEIREKLAGVLGSGQGA